MAIAFLVWYIVWGVPLTVRLFNWYKSKLADRRHKRSLKKFHLFHYDENSKVFLR